MVGETEMPPPEPYRYVCRGRVAMLENAGRQGILFGPAQRKIDELARRSNNQIRIGG
jgi:hypothetical protein